MNKIILIGRLTDDPEIGYYGDDSMYAQYTLAVTRANGLDADFIRCTSFGRNAEVAEEYFNKGMKIAISGRLEIKRYDSEAGVRYYTSVLVDSQEFCEKKPDSSESDSKGREKPSDSKGREKPSDSKGREKPSASKGREKPSASKGREKPSASKGRGKPSASKGRGVEGFMNIPDGTDEELPFN